MLGNFLEIDNLFVYTLVSNKAGVIKLVKVNYLILSSYIPWIVRRGVTLFLDIYEFVYK